MRWKTYRVRVIASMKALALPCLVLAACAAPSCSHLPAPSRGGPVAPSSVSSSTAIDQGAVSLVATAAGPMTQLALGAAHSCALAASGTVWCWGGNEAGQLGNGALRGAWRPSQVRGLVDAVEIKASNHTTCARSRAGEVSCWGSNYAGQVSPTPSLCSRPPPNVESQCPQPLPLKVPGVSGAVAIAVGRRHACAILLDGTVTCWGDNSRAQLSTSLPRSAFQRALAGGLPKSIAIAAAGTHTCVVSEDKHVWCWGGDNDVGQLGTADKRPTLRRVPAVSDALNLESDTWRVCARVPSGFSCWGDMQPCFTGQVPGPPIRSIFSREVSQLARATEACASCVLLQNARVKCRFMEVGKLTPEREVLPNARTLAAGDEHFCSILPSGKVACWGANDSGQIGLPPGPARNDQPHLIEWDEGK